jgi:hypothetical protein
MNSAFFLYIGLISTGKYILVNFQIHTFVKRC